MEHQSQEDGEKWAAQLNNPLPGEKPSEEDDNESLAMFRQIM